MTPGPITGHLRGGLVGVMVSALAVAAHGTAGGGHPGSAELTLILLIAVVAGCAGDTVLARRRRCTVVGLLAGGQLAGHLALTGLGHTHSASNSALPTGWMLVAHTVATLICAVLIVLAERLYAVASRVVGSVLGTPHAPSIVGAPRWSNPRHAPYLASPNGASGPRAPPMPA
ncbi:hypothetical protein [Nocardia callitridis]|uniref:Uncharacterized protein n=1 Tax=Nocardia callitridis TaxID=648753 RepID=A0ABP9K0G2_9NOCA